MWIFRLIGRIFNLGKGKADRAVEREEKKDPDAILRVAIEDAGRDIRELTELARDAKGAVFAKDNEIKSEEKVLADLKADLKLAIAGNDTVLGPKLVKEIEESETKLLDLKEERTLLNEEAESVLDAKGKAKDELEELKEEQQRASSMEKSHSVLSRIQARKEGLATDNVSKALGSARERINAIKADRAAMRGTASEVSFEDARKALREKADGNSAADAFAAMVAKNKKPEKAAAKK